MTMPDEPQKQSGPLARVGQNDSFAGLTRIGILFVGAALAWAAFDFRAALSRIDENQRAIIAVADRTTHLEDSTTNTANSIKEFRLWAESQVVNLVTQTNTDAKSINDLDRAQGKLSQRVLCLENKVRCPQ